MPDHLAPHRGAAAPTVQDVAAAAGVSPMTVSRVLNGGPNVRPQKIQAVLDAAAALGYRRNENARSIRPGQRTGLLGVIITNVANPYYAQVQLGVEEIVSSDGMRLLVGNSGEDVHRERALVNDFIGRKVDGLIVVPAGGDVAHLRAATAVGIPLALASRQVDGVDADVVLVDDEGGARDGTAHLLAEGHRRIAFLGNRSSVFTSRRRQQGFERAHAEAGVAFDPILLRAGQNDDATAHDVTLELLALDEPPTAIFSANNRNTVGALRALSERRDLAESLRIVAFDDFELSSLVPFALSVIEHDPRELGRTAARMVMARLHSTVDSVAQTIELPTHFRP
ncbi:LacI family DNA-binding transcriptional regulator [Microbacterium sp. SA39]|uniref:LacI family DNA-binding transcriptional regulator n=1 Tax=Microbacterium sp. SA39 TaxID=1263625 RepID=UPI0005F9BCA0|nr:LacI family DNA-binding transcriptional regulator [Microbacterium sp. SA39]KJQ55626.1 Catabolite control protein A [Microbacterium sp. SA39]